MLYNVDFQAKDTRNMEDLPIGPMHSYVTSRRERPACGGFQKSLGGSKGSKHVEIWRHVRNLNVTMGKSMGKRQFNHLYSGNGDRTGI